MSIEVARPNHYTMGPLLIPHGVGVEASVSLGQDVIGWRQSKTTGETLRENVVVGQFA
jgi:hypothetical protein